MLFRSVFPGLCVCVPWPVCVCVCVCVCGWCGGKQAVSRPTFLSHQGEGSYQTSGTWDCEADRGGEEMLLSSHQRGDNRSLQKPARLSYKFNTGWAAFVLWDQETEVREGTDLSQVSWSWGPVSRLSAPSSTPVVWAHQNHPEAGYNTGPKPRVSDLAGPGWSPEPAFLTSSQVLLLTHLRTAALDPCCPSMFRGSF